MTTLKDVANLLDSHPTAQEAFDSGIVNSYIMLIMKVGAESVSRLSDDEKIASLSILQSYAATYGLESGNITQQDLNFLVSERFGGIVATLFRACVGIANIEELI